MSIRAFIFDLDGVITDTAEYHYRAWKQLSDQCGFHFDREINEKLKGVSRMDSLEIILRTNDALEKFNREEKEEMANRKNGYYVEWVQKITSEDVLPGIRSLLHELKLREIKTAVASASHNVFTVMERLELGSAFDVIVDPATIAKGKPDPEIFLTAANALRESATSCVGVEDAAAGIEAIRAAGMFAVGIGDPDALKKANLVLRRTEDLTLETIERIFPNVAV